MNTFNDDEWKKVDRLIQLALDEDVGSGDLTTEYLVPSGVTLEAEWFSKEPCVLAGLPVIDRILSKAVPEAKNFWLACDGQAVEAGPFGLVKGPARQILTVERTCLNILQRLAGIATLTSEFVRRSRRYKVKIYDTRKTTPGLRLLEKYAVRCGGGHNHRMGLDEMVLAKENHREVLDDIGMGDLAGLVARIRAERPGVLIGIEARSREETDRAVREGADFVLLDNMNADMIREIVGAWKGRVILEASGGVRLDNVEALAATGVDRLSVGALTHSVRAADISLEVLGVR